MQQTVVTATGSSTFLSSPFPSQINIKSTNKSESCCHPSSSQGLRLLTGFAPPEQQQPHQQDAGDFVEHPRVEEFDTLVGDRSTTPRRTHRDFLPRPRRVAVTMQLRVPVGRASALGRGPLRPPSGPDGARRRYRSVQGRRPSAGVSTRERSERNLSSLLYAFVGGDVRLRYWSS